MKIKLIIVGKTDDKHLQSCIDEYVRRLGFYNPFEIVVIQDIKNSKSLSEDQQKQKEGELILRHGQNCEQLVLLDEKGTQYTSEEFAGFIQKKQNSGIKTLAFVIGGPYGFSQDVYHKANGLLSLSKMTFSHQMVRLFFTEQLYRAFTILKNEPYHHR
ncbi:MAG TPA: 23S rRNA (pseudouridine(1915)-N(3))-methyltransferase RlmH [Flavobacteriaceae bacterium]|nr:23S rRNA (pseudouridine(1915)-N(3))-methyltransferase RlmH [Flavobacteriaceae bacterium]